MKEKKKIEDLPLRIVAGIFSLLIIYGFFRLWSEGQINIANRKTINHVDKKVINEGDNIVGVGFDISWSNYKVVGKRNDILNRAEGKPLNKDFNKKIKSANLSTDYSVSQTLADIETLKLNTITLPIVVEVENISSSNFKISTDSLIKGKELLKKLEGRGISIILEPYLWINNGAQYEGAFDPTDKEAFFQNYKTEVLKLIIEEVAIPYRVDAINIATGLNKLENMEDEICGLIDFTREHYMGLVTYRTSFWVTANWRDEDTKDRVSELRKGYEKKLNNKIFSKVDFISIASYFELTDNESNTVENLVGALASSKRFSRGQEIKNQIERFYRRWNKPIFFGELGFPRTDMASVEPWNPLLSKNENGVEQANCFEAYRRVFERESWLLGFSYFAVGEKGKDKMYYPSDETVSVIKKWFNRE